MRIALVFDLELGFEFLRCEWQTLVLSAGLSEKDYDIPAQAKARSYADAAVSRNQNIPASWEVRESIPLGMSDEANQFEELSLKNDSVKNSADNGMQQKFIRMVGKTMAKTTGKS